MVSYLQVIMFETKEQREKERGERERERERGERERELRHTWLHG